HRLVPLDHLAQMAIALVRRLPRVLRAADVAAVDHVNAARRQRLAQAGDAQGVRSEAGAAVAGADVGRHADQGNGRVLAAHRASWLVPAPGFELGTYRLQGGCSTN